MKLRTIGLALVATGFMASSALAQATMQPIPNPSDKAAHSAKHSTKKKHAAKPAEAGTPAPADAKSDAAPKK
ncbi:hypothetical protein [Phenylobacterium sp.]|uniref:hypothetical protein n=1 Tax=Phenylobacterium sp. TaxID=1871053 RepID=UPI002F3EB648